jgi:hypothetical protein
MDEIRRREEGPFSRGAADLRKYSFPFNRLPSAEPYKANRSSARSFKVKHLEFFR